MTRRGGSGVGRTALSVLQLAYDRSTEKTTKVDVVAHGGRTAARKWNTALDADIDGHRQPGTLLSFMVTSALAVGVPSLVIPSNQVG